MMKFRQHRGSLSESMETTTEVNSIDDIIEIQNKAYSWCGKEVAEIKFTYCDFDERINWNTYYVLQRFKGSEDFVVAGMSDGKFEDKLIEKWVDITMGNRGS